MLEAQSLLVKKGKAVTNENLRLELEKEHIILSKYQFIHAKNKARESSNFVLEISQTQYSGFIEEVWDNLSTIEDHAFSLADGNWDIETVRSGAEDRNSYTEIQNNQYKPKHDFYKLALEVQKAKLDLLKGDVINVSVAMLQKKFASLKEESELKSIEIERLKEKQLQ